MKALKSLILLAGCYVLASSLKAQGDSIGHVHVTPRAFVREADVCWQKRIWRRLDLRVRQNLPLYYPVDNSATRPSLVQIISGALLQGRLAAYRDQDLTQAFTRAEIRNKLVLQSDSVWVELIKPNGDPYYVREAGVTDSTWINSAVCSLELCEDWFFDRQRSSLDVWIFGLGICVVLPQKEELGCNTLFYLNFEQCRPFLAQYPVFVQGNDQTRLTYEKLFVKRMFESTVIEESNVYDRPIEAYAAGVDALLESDRVKEELLTFEHDLWHY